MDIYAYPPLPKSGIRKELNALGVSEGMTLLVHSSLKSFGRWIPGGSQAVVEALEEAVGPTGTLVMPTQTADLSEPSNWIHPPVPESWWPIIREEMPPFRPDLTPTRAMGAVVEAFRRREGARRSAHPQLSFAARGPLAEAIVGEHPLVPPLGESSPLGRLYEHGAHVLLLGVGHVNSTSLHLAEHRADWPGKRMIRQGAPMLEAGERRWVEYEELAYDDSDFEAIGEAFEASHPQARRATIGACLARLMPMRALVDFAAEKMARRRPGLDR
ncbi:AAC(3) family N-acetyltransferase [Paenibacillus albicereus]|uniref:Aminoglycoside N(3)-acetyltransferase n=1 Tax=Paenibacillus albicereus TaxID=2726185 RepID=A0A6H2H1I7_9BACL|nr:AAC(3) family N-acetyltransferase [Paenibacillus albicereus]QJC53505.1 AAC(3) family N-acetyltransferase [Paenibacillus albicereus]